MTMKGYDTILVGTDGSDLADPTVARAAWLAAREDADLVIICAYSELSRRAEAKNTATTGGDVRAGQVMGRSAASAAIAAAVAVAEREGATIARTQLVDGDPAKALVQLAGDHSAGLIVLGAVHDRSLADRLLGTTAEEVTKQAVCDVLIVRPASGEAEFEVPESADEAAPSTWVAARIPSGGTGRGPYDEFAAQPAGACTSRRRILPVGPLGSSTTCHTVRGYL